jgi:hypothetical protein
MIKFKVSIPKKIRIKLKPREIDEAAKILVDDLQQTVPYDTGKLFRGIRKKKTTDGVQIYIQGKRNNEVAGYLIEGTKDHFIRPKGSRLFTKTGRRLKSLSTRKIKKSDRGKRVLAWEGADGGVHYSAGHFVKGIKKGYWKFQPRKRAINQFTKRIMTFIKAR